VNAFGELVRQMATRGNTPALHLGDQTVTFAALAEQVTCAGERLRRSIPAEAVVVSLNEFSLDGIATMLGLAMNGCIVVPVSTAAEAQFEEIGRVSRAQFIVGPNRDIRTAAGDGDHDLYMALRERHTPGLVLFSSGSTGAPKGAVHDFGKILANMPSGDLKATLVAFLLYDHIGGVNTLLRSLRGGGTLVLPEHRSPEAVASAIEQHGATILPTSPSFLAMLLASGALRHHDLSSLRVITYGTEVMPQALLERVSEALPAARLKQTYGLSEVGILSTQSESDSSTWLRLGGDGFDVRVVDGMLEIRSDSAMLGYLNSPSPFTADGWFRTFDEVEVRGDLFRILGRKSEMINVGGLKVFPQEVESALLEIPFVMDCVVFAVASPLTGQAVGTEITLAPDYPDAADTAGVRSAIRSHLRGVLDPHKIPTEIRVVDNDDLVSARFKKTRSARS
jgi:acyl-CoA synthetase (AMP-forming)/AMP-acid ligase II